MLKVVGRVLAFLSRIALAIRYRIRLKGLESLNLPAHKKGTLFLSNHPSLIDPFINYVILWPKFQMRPVVIEYIFEIKLLKSILQSLRAIAIPNFGTAVNEYKIRQAEKSIVEIIEGLKKGESFFIAPSGQVKRCGKEILGGTLISYEILKSCPDINIVLIRTTGLWGSRFSRAFTKKTPELSQVLLEVWKIILKNFIFFVPKRKITIEYKLNPQELPRNPANKLEINSYLEKWFNQYTDEMGQTHEVEPLNLVSYNMWKNEVPQVFTVINKNREVEIHKETREKVYHELRRILDKPDLEIAPDMNLGYDLGIDSLNISELITFAARNFEVMTLYPEDLETVDALLIALSGGPREKHLRESSTLTWPVEKQREETRAPEGKTIIECFLNSCQRMKHAIACGDNQGISSYMDLKKQALILAHYFQNWAEDRVAVMLPASRGVYLTILALLFARKIPVLLNWTLGSRYLEQMMEMSGAKKIVTSWKFLDTIYSIQLGNCIDKLVLLEEIAKEITLPMKLKGLVYSKCSSHFVLKTMGLTQIDENDPLIILFTSGTEALPKGVPLTHKNVLSNMRATLQRIDVLSTDVLFCILPPFHSFGLTATGLYPLLVGVRAAYYFDPTDAFALVEGIKRWGVTFFLSTPGFAKAVLQIAAKDEIQSVRYFILGSEKTPEHVYKRVEDLQTGAKLIEGYGITECSSIVSLNPVNQPPKGVGYLLPGIEMITIHPETHQLLPDGSTGEICVKGPTIFNGYLGNVQSPFIEIDQNRWYRTGDLGHREPDGSIILSGRLKRFIKISGEMISLGAVEETIAKHLRQIGKIPSDPPSVAAIAHQNEESGNPRITLFITIDIHLDEINHILHSSGFSNLVKISSVKKIESLPLTGAGKMDYRKLENSHDFN